MPKIDTHHIAVQASAYGLIKQLQKVYPEIGRLPLHPETEQHELTQGAQASLLEYLQILNDPDRAPLSQAEKATLLDNECISATIKLIDAIQALPESTLSNKDKRSIFQQVGVIAKTYPGGAWDKNHAQWSINRRYNPTTRQDEQIMTSPAETLNLVSRALLDETRYSSSNEHATQRDLEFRIETFYTHMLSLQQQVDAGSLQKCSAGLQHDLLYFLNRTYLDKPSSEQGQPVILLMDTESFLLETLSAFIDQKLHGFNNRSSIVLDWIRWQADFTANPEECPLILCLQTLFPSLVSADPDLGWKEICKEYIAAHCAAFGLNPALCPIDTFVENLSSVPIPTGIVTPLVVEAVSMKALHVNGLAPFPERSLEQLILLRNDALKKFREFRPETQNWYSINSDAIYALYNSAALVASLNHYKEITLLMDKEDAEFLRAREALKTFLFSYLKTYTPEAAFKSLAEFEEVQSDYRTAERQFLTSSHSDFVSNFFALIEEKTHWEVFWKIIQAMRAEGEVSHPLVLTDETLENWRRQSGSISEDGVAVVDISPYAINRLLLHGLLVPPIQWTPTYCHYLLIVTGWLSSPPAADESLSFKTLKQAYPPFLLANLTSLALLVNSDTPEAQKLDWLQRLKGSHAEFNFNWLDMILKDPHLNHSNKTQILIAVKVQLERLIQDGSQLAYLFSHTPPLLNEADRAQIFSALKGRFDTMIKDANQLIELLSLKPAQLNEAQRKQIWSDLGRQLNTLIKNPDQLIQLLSLTPEQLSEDQRRQVLSALEGQFSILIENSSQLCELFSLSTEQLNEFYREKIWSELKGRSNKFIKDAAQLMRLFQLVPQQLNDSQRTEILEGIQDRLDIFIQNKYQLFGLFQLPIKQLSDSQRAQIVAGLEERVDPLREERIAKILNDVDGRIELLNEEQQKQVAIMPDRGLVKLIRNINDLLQLFNLPQKQLSETLRTQILTGLGKRLITLTENTSELLQLFHLSLQKLNEAQRSQILNASQVRLSLLVKNYEQLMQLFSLTPEQLNEAQRTQILTALRGRLSILIQNKEQLIHMFQLPFQQLSETQRTQIWQTVEKKMSKLIEESELNSLYLSLFPKKLQASSRDSIHSFFRDVPDVPAALEKPYEQNK